MNFLCADNGLYAEQCLGLTKGGNKVKYYTNWPSAFPKYEEYAVGEGFEDEGMEKVLYFHEHFDWADCVCNLDVHGNSDIAFMRRKFPSKSIVGCGLGEKLENDRWGFKKIQKQLGLKVQKSVRLKGIEELRKYLKENKDKYVKLNIWRESHESFYAKDYKSVELILDEIESAFGPRKNLYEFVVEDTIHTDVEIGFDGFFNGVDYCRPFFLGYEMLKNLYIAKVSDEFPQQLAETMNALKPVLQKLDYRGPLSTEEKIVSKTEHYFLDFCARLPAPLSALYPQYILNWPQLIYNIGLKNKVSVDIPYKYVGAFALGSEHSSKHWLEIDVDKKDRDHVKFRMVTKNEGRYYAIPGMDSVVVLVAGGNTVDQVLQTLKKYSTKVSAYGLDNESVNGIDKIKEIIKNGEKVGIDFS